METAWWLTAKEGRSQSESETQAVVSTEISLILHVYLVTLSRIIWRGSSRNIFVHIWKIVS